MQCYYALLRPGEIHPKIDFRLSNLNFTEATEIAKTIMREKGWDSADLYCFERGELTIDRVAA